MPYAEVPLNITGPSYQSRSKPLSSQRTVNWYQQLSEGGKDNYVLMPFPGLKVFATSNPEADRGLWRMAEVLYQVKGNTLYRISNAGVYESLGEIPGKERCIMADDGINLFIVTNRKVYHYNSDDNSINQVTDPDIDGAISVDIINNQFIYTKEKFTTISNVGDGTQANALNVIGAETKPDNLVRDYVFEQIIWRFGERTIEGWWNSGVGQPPIERLDGQMFDVGCASKYSITQTDEFFYWLGDDYAIYRATGGAKQRISTDAISNELRSFDRIDDAIGNTFTIQGQNFYMITFPGAGRTFVNNEALGNNGWFELSSGVNGGIYQGSEVVSCYGKNLVADFKTGKIYELDLQTYTNNLEPIRRERVLQAIDARIIGGKQRNRVGMDRLYINMETGVGLIDGQGDNPRIMVEYSDDGGRTWSHGSWPRVGRLGEFVLLVQWDNLETFYNRIIRISTTDPVNYSVYSASAGLRLAGR
jgi:hypothetical protein